MSRITLVVGLIAAARAWACSGLTCESTTVTVPRSGSTIPSNAPAVGVQLALFSDVMMDGGVVLLTQTPTTAALQLRAPDGGLVVGPAVETQLGVFVATTLVPGSWSMSFDQGCYADARFEVGAAAPLPTFAATLSLVETLWVPAGQSNCFPQYPAGQAARLRIEASAEMLPWLSLARWELEVDGMNLSTSRFGRLTPQPYDDLGPPQYSAINLFTVQCEPTPDGGTPRRLWPGTHEARLVARILGVNTPILSNTLQVEMSCTPPVPPDAGVDAVDGGAQSDAGSTAAPPPHPSGCSSVGVLSVISLLCLLFPRPRTLA